MMQTLDEILYSRSEIAYRNKLKESLDLSSWTKDNRDGKLGQVREATELIAKDTISFTSELLETFIDGKNLLYWKILEQFISMELNVLTDLRQQLDQVDVKELATQPVDYEWLTATIRERIQELYNVASKIEAELEKTGEAVEI